MPGKKSKTKKGRKKPQARNASGETKKEVKETLFNLFKMDPRGPMSSGSSLISLNVNEALPIAVASDANFFYSTILASISYAVSRGWLANVSNDSFPFAAWIYMGRALVFFAQGATVETGNVPHWFALLIQAVIKTEAKLGSGLIQYQFDIKNDANEIWLTGVGPSAYGRAYNLGVKSTTVLINGDIPVMEPPVAYNDTLGRQAVQSLWVFLAGKHKGDPMHQMVPNNKKNIMTNDHSAFAFNEVWPGNGIYNTGGYSRRSLCEVGVARPEFSVFSVKPTSNTTFTNRFPRKVVNYSGDALSLGASLVYHLKEKEMLRRTPPNIKFVDFGEVLDVLYKWVTEVISKEVQTSFFLDNYVKDPNYFDNVRCPLTLQQVALMFRQTVLSTNIEDQIAYQGMYPRTPSSSSDSEFVSYVCGNGTVPVPNTSMPLLPLLLKENLNSLRGSEVKPKGDKTTNPISWATVYGEFFGTKFNRGDYTVQWSANGTAVIDLVFADETGEVPISLVDGRYGLTQYAAINDPSYLVRITALWNSWIQGRTDTARGLATMGSDDGVKALYVGGVTRYWIEQIGENIDDEDEKVDPTIPPKGIKMTKKKREEYAAYVKRQRKLDKKAAINIGPYRDRAFLAYSANYMIFKQPWQVLQQFWITPCIKISARNLNEDDTTGVYMQGAQYNEPRTIIPAQGEAFFPTLSASHSAYASLMVKMPFAEPAEYQKVLLELSEKGEAGILGTIGGTLVSELGSTAAQLGGRLISNIVPY